MSNPDRKSIAVEAGDAEATAAALEHDETDELVQGELIEADDLAADEQAADPE